MTGILILIFFHLAVELFEKEYISALLNKDDDLPITQAIMKTELFSHDLTSGSIISSFVSLDTTKIPTPAIVIPSCASKDQLNDLEDMLGKYIDAAQQYAYIISPQGSTEAPSFRAGRKCVHKESPVF